MTWYECGGIYGVAAFLIYLHTYPSRVTDFKLFVSSAFSGCRVGECSFLAAVYGSRQDEAVRGDVRDPSG